MRNFILSLVLIFCIPNSFVCADDGTIRISSSYKTIFSTPQQTGMLDLVLVEAFRRIGLRAEIVFVPTERSLIAVNEGLFDGEMNRISGMEENFPNLVRVPEANMTMHFMAFAVKDIPITGWESLRPLRVGVVKGWKILERHTKGFPHLTRVMSAEQLFNMLHAGRIDVGLYSELGGLELIRSLHCDHVRCLDPPLVSREMFLYLHKKHRALIEPLAKALREMKRDGTYDGLVQKTTGYLR